MRTVAIGAVLAAAALVLFASPAPAQFGGGGAFPPLPDLPDPGNSPPSDAYCTDFANAAVQLAQQASDLKCGFNANAPQWSTNAASQNALCKSLSLNAANAAQSSQRSEVDHCTACRGYAKAAVSAAIVNVRYECGFGGPRWGLNEDAHFGWCIALSSTSPVDIGPFSVPMPNSWQASFGPATSEAGARAQDIAQCKATHQPRDCRSCHGGSSEVSSAPVKTSPTVLRVVPKRGTNSGGSNQVVRSTSDPCGSELRPCKPTRVLGPGLLEGDGGGLGPQGPAAATGTPIQIQRGGGSGLR